MRWGKRQPLVPIREWVDSEGETHYALHPLYAGFGHFYAPDKPGIDSIPIILERLSEIAIGERRLPDEVAETMLEWDSEQQANGCPDENIAGLVELLRSSAGA